MLGLVHEARGRIAGRMGSAEQAQADSEAASIYLSKASQIRPRLAKPAAEDYAKEFKKPISEGVTPSTKVQGRISGTDVLLNNASFENGQLAIYAGDSWAFNPSVLIFLFTAEGTVPEDKLFSATPQAQFTGKTPHVHYRWQSDKSEQVKTDVVMDGYRLHLKFGQAVEGKIPGKILFEIPEKDTRIEGHFIAEIRD